MEKLWKGIAEHPFVTTFIGIVAFFFTAWPSISRETIPEFLTRKGWSLTVQPWYVPLVIGIGCLVAALQIILIRTIQRKQVETASSTIRDSTQFYIEPLTRQFTDTLTLEIKAKITAFPLQCIEKIELELPGYSLLPALDQQWPLTVGSEFMYEHIFLYFRVPPSIPNGKYSAALVTTRKEQDSTTTKKFPLFDITLTRSYENPLK